MVYEIFLVNIVGTDRKGLTNALATILAAHEVRVLDIGQAVIHDHLSLGMLLAAPEGIESCEVLKQLLFKSHELNLSIRLSPISSEEYEEWVLAQSQERTVFTLLGRTITAEALRRFTGILVEQGLNIETISRLSQRVSLRREFEADIENASADLIAAKDRRTPQKACVEFAVIGTPANREIMAASIMGLTQEEDVDISVQRDDMYRRNRRLVVFDMDSTLIQCEVIDELAKLAGVGDKVSAITERAMRGELDFKSSFRERLTLLKGLPFAQAQELADHLPLTEGAERLFKVLKMLGYKTAICSGGFTLFGRKLQDILGIDYVFANELEVEDGKLTGRVSGEIVDGARKAALMSEIASELGLSLRQTIAVGDGANDLPMINQAGLGIAFRAKSLVRANARHAISVLGLDGLLYLIGVRDRDILQF